MFGKWKNAAKGDKAKKAGEEQNLGHDAGDSLQ